MSICLRRILESYIKTQKEIVLREIMKIKKQAMMDLDYEQLNQINTLEGIISTLNPQISNYQSPENYVKALKIYALAYSYITLLIETEIEAGAKIVAITKLATAIKTAREGDIQHLADIIKNQLQPTVVGRERQIEAMRRYLVTIIRNCGPDSLDPQDKNMLKNTLTMTIISEDKPYVTIEELSVRIGIKPNKTRKIIKEIMKTHKEIILQNDIVTTETKITEWIKQGRKRGEELETLRKNFAKQLEKTYYKTIEETIQKLKQLVTT